MSQLPDGFLDVFSVAMLPSTHSKAFVERGGKAIRTTTEYGFLCFGQYKRGYPVMPLQAIFSIQIGNNTMDDRNIFILDVYDHHSDRVIGKRVITRKDFEKAHEFCLFTFDFTPPSAQANMEFRMYYMGYAYVLADKIAVIDPSKVSVTQTSQLPASDVSESEDTDPEVIELEETQSGLPDPWKIARIRNADGKVLQHNIISAEINSGKGVLEYQAEFTIETTGEESHGSADDLFFIYQKWSDRSANGKIVGTFPVRQQGFVGVMFRESLEPGAKFIMLENNRVLYRQKRGGGVTEKKILGTHGRGFKLIRKKKGREQRFIVAFSKKPSGNSNDTDAHQSIKFRMSQEVYVGVAAGNSNATVKIGTSYKDSNYKK